MTDSRLIEIPNWCRIGLLVKVKYPENITGDNNFWTEKIIAYSDNGFFTQAHNCPVYHHTFDEWERTVKQYDKN